MELAAVVPARVMADNMGSGPPVAVGTGIAAMIPIQAAMGTVVAKAEIAIDCRRLVDNSYL